MAFSRVRRGLSGLLHAAARRVDVKAPEQAMPKLSIDTYNPEGSVVVADIDWGSVAFKVLTNGEVNCDALSLLKEALERGQGNNLHKFNRKGGYHVIIDSAVAQFTVLLNSEGENSNIIGEDFTKMVLDEIMNWAEEYGYSVHVIGADRMKKIKIPEENKVGISSSGDVVVGLETLEP